MRNWEKHEDVIQKILLMINTKYPCMFVLKGGTALRQCYGLDRRSEDIDLDGRNLELDIGQVIKEYCKKNGHTFNLRKDTRQTRRFILHYADAPSADDLLKIEISYRKSEFPDYMYKIMDGICVYNIDELAAMKAIAYYREKIRDLYDICFIVDHYYDQLSPRTINSLQDTLGRHGLDFAGKMLLEQKDALIDSSYLEEAVIRTFIRLGLGDDEAPQKCISNKDHHKDISDDDDDDDDYLGY